MQLPEEKEYTLPVTAYGAGGEGICKIDGYTVFVPFAAVGDVVSMRLLKAGKRFGYGKLLKVLTPSADRANATCGQFGVCGGCSLLHLSADAQKAFKQQRVAGCLAHVGGLSDCLVHETVSLNATGYRNKVMLPVAAGPDGAPQAGFYAPKSHDIVPSAGCLLQPPENDAVTACVLSWMKKNKIPAYDAARHTGTVRHIYTRYGFATGEAMVSIVANCRELPASDDLCRSLLALDLGRFSIVSVMHNINQKPGNTILQPNSTILHGRDYIFDKIGPLTFKISHNAFFQVNPSVTALLYEKALSLCGLVGNETVFDLYCGAGTISLFLAQRAKQVIGVEIVPQAVADARFNATLNHMDNAVFYEGDAPQTVQKLYAQGTRADVVVVDPPRKGCDETLLCTIRDMAPRRMVYVSCDPATLARDAKVLSGFGYRMAEAHPFDMFPGTPHVETIVLLQRETL